MRNIKRIVVVLGIGVLTLLLFNIWSHYDLIIKDQETNTEYIRLQVQAGDQLEFAWIHSVELTPWIEVLEVTRDERLKLIETRFQSYGAGVPHATEGNALVKDGYTIMTELEQFFTSYRWIHSHNAQFTLSRNGKNVFLADELPHHQLLEMFIEKR
jgi:hypothetical protein